MWAPRFAFDWHERVEDRDETAEKPPVTAIAMLRSAVAVGVLAAIFFLVFPDFDLAFSHAFYLGDKHFFGYAFAPIPLMRFAFSLFFVLICMLTISGIVMAARKAGPWLDLTLGKWLFLALCLITGPLVVANIGFKDHWGRARPRNVIEFGGTKEFTAPFPPSGQCDYNCSFVSGEASSIFIVMFAAAFLFKSRSRNFVAMGIVLGSIAGLIRITQGGHFLSDVIFAGVSMAITAAVIQIVFETLAAERVQPEEPRLA